METCDIETLPFSSFREIEDLVRGFETGTLAREEWTHGAHLTVACWYLLHHTLIEATRLIRDGIKRYNNAKGIVTTATSGYHETMTLFWIHMVDGYLRDARPCASVALFNELLARCGDKGLPLEYYSRERLMSVEARARWVEPDLKPL